MIGHSSEGLDDYRLAPGLGSSAVVKGTVHLMGFLSESDRAAQVKLLGGGGRVCPQQGSHL